jgi:hypothetical protein
MFTMKSIGFARTPFAEKSEIPKGPCAQHTAEGILEINADL